MTGGLSSAAGVVVTLDRVADEEYQDDQRRRPAHGEHSGAAFPLSRTELAFLPGSRPGRRTRLVTSVFIVDPPGQLQYMAQGPAWLGTSSTGVDIPDAPNGSRWRAANQRGLIADQERWTLLLVPVNRPAQTHHLPDETAGPAARLFPLFPGLAAAVTVPGPPGTPSLGGGSAASVKGAVTAAHGRLRDKEELASGAALRLAAAAPTPTRCSSCWQACPSSRRPVRLTRTAGPVPVLY